MLLLLCTMFMRGRAVQVKPVTRTLPLVTLSPLSLKATCLRPETKVDLQQHQLPLHLLRSRFIQWCRIPRRLPLITTALVLSPPCGQGLSRMNIAWRLPREWHTYWRLWAALQAGQAWDCRHKPAFSCLRRAIGDISTSSDTQSARTEQGPPCALLDLVAATVTFRQVIGCVQRQGLLWIPGSPSRSGIGLLRALLPEAIFRLLPLRSGAVFVAAHPRCPADSWLTAISSLGGIHPHSVQSQAIRASLVYRTLAASS